MSEGKCGGAVMLTRESKAIRIDGEVWEELKARAERYGLRFATPNDVLRRALDMPAREGRMSRGREKT